MDENATVGPQREDIESLFPRSYSLLVDSGWLDTLVVAGNVSCSWCPQLNSLARGGPFWIDHIFVARNATNVCVLSSNTFATEPMVPSESQRELVHLSDHFGVEATVCV